LENQVTAGGSDVAYAIDKSTNSLHYMRGIRIEASCLMCHGDPKNSTSGDGLDPLGFRMENWPVGKLHGTYHVVMPLSVVDKQVASFIGYGLLWSVPLVIAGVGLFVWLLRRIFNRPVNALIERIKDIAQGEGDLTQRVAVTNQDELGQLGGWFNQFVAKIHDLIAEISGVTRDVASASTQIASSAEELAGGISEQNQQMTQISAAVEEMSSSIIEVAKKSGQAAQNADESGKVAQEGGQVVQETIQGMTSIDQAVTASAASVAELGKRGEQIGQIIGVINDIADQTNLLALNAAIEAARAGEHGRGFAVVADEVRKLADRTTKATEEIAKSIQAIQQETSQAVDRMNSGTEQVKQGVTRATQAGQSLQKIVSGAKEVATMISSIAAAAEEQSAAAEQVARNIESISAVTRQASEGTQQAAEASAGLSRTAEQLQRLVGRFKIHERPADQLASEGGPGAAGKTPAKRTAAMVKAWKKNQAAAANTNE
ncbi:MAG: HAMP domain-containing protein, partial [Phycisphaeraceae bacterium]|nr:HAMP domain-containing protein [Phycisphaeraceae bacterium]